MNYCATCKYHVPPGDGFQCGNPSSEYYTWFRNDYKTCDKWEKRIEKKEKENNDDGRVESKGGKR